MQRERPDRPWVGIGVVMLRGDEVLLIRRGRPPGLGSWSFPGGAQHLGETAEAAARRELAEETGLTAGALQLLEHADVIEHDAAGKVRFHYTILDFHCEWQGGEPCPGDDAAEACFVKLAGLGDFALTQAATAMIHRAVKLRPILRVCGVCDLADLGQGA